MLALIVQIIQKIKVVVFFWVTIFPSVAISGVFTFDKVEFLEEQNGGKIGSWSQLIFEVQNPRVDGRSYLGQEKIRFSIGHNKTDIKFSNSWLTSRVYLSTKSPVAYIGGDKLRWEEKNDLKTLTPFEWTALAWIIVNSDELIGHALNSPVNVLFAPLSRPHWSNYLSKGVFEKNLRKNFGLVSEIRYLIKDHDDYAKHNKTLLKNKIQPGLAKLGYYSGAIDGLIGPATVTAIKKLEKEFGLFPDGILIEPRELNLLAGGGGSDDLKLGESVAAENYTADSEASTLRSQVESLRESLKRKSILVDQITKQKDSVEKASAARQEVVTQLSLDIRKLEDVSKLTVKRKNERILLLEEQALAYRADQTDLELALGEKSSEISALTLEFRAAKNLNSKLQSTLSRVEEKLKNDAETLKIRIAGLEVQVASLTTELSESISLNVEPSQSFTLSEDWSQYKQWITPSQMRFCSILHEYEIAKEEAASSGNQLLQNIAIKNRDSNIAALLNASRSGQDGFRSWVSVVKSVFAIDAINPSSGKVELAAGVILKTPCNITLGTGRVIDQIGNATSEFKYLAFDGDLIFSQLTSVRRGDPVLFDGSFERSTTGASEKFVTNEFGKEQKLEAYDRPTDAPDMFVNITYLAKL
tara:strand:- start:1012 stop:2937 length:1926 start_codon:yes stop_codon:yes gene_type:complete